METLRDELTERERQFWLGGAEFYRENLSGRCIMVVPGVGQMPRDQVIEGIEGGDRWREVWFSEMQLVELSAGAVLLVYDAEAERDSMDEAYRAHVSSVYSREDEGWKLTFHQQTISG